jgi:acyl-CoA synthetase (AMP-forming)/AMP-acid ligase II
MSVDTLLRNTARAYGARLALEHAGRSLTYKQLDERTDRIAAGMRCRGLCAGDRLLLFMPNQTAFVEALFAGFKAGIILVPLNMRLHPREVEYIARDAEASAIAFDPVLDANGALSAALGTVANLQMWDVHTLPEDDPSGEHRGPSDADPAWLFYTSGTTGKPKGAVLTHGNLMAMTLNCIADLHRFEHDDIALHVAPLSHGSGLYMLPSIAGGAFNILHSGTFDPGGFFKTVAERRITVVPFMVPTHIAALVEHPDASSADLGSLRCVIYGGAPMYQPHIQKALRLWGPIWAQLYGQGETPMTGTYLSKRAHVECAEHYPERLKSIGVARTGIDLQIVDKDARPVAQGEVGEIVIRGATVMSGYWMNPEASAAVLRNGGLHTGDLGYVDKDGYVFLLDRAKDMIISGGSNIYAREVEDVLASCPGVQEAVVIGVPDAYWGEFVHAIVVSEPGQDVTEAAIMHYCEQHIASYKKPRSMEFVERIPKNAYGKVSKRELREQRSQLAQGMKQ